MATDRVVRLTPWLCGAVALAAYTWLAAPGMYWLDSEELASAAVRLGVAHPTGFPLFCVFGRLLAWLPVGELAFRVHLGSALAAALAVAVAARLVIVLTREDLTGALAGAAAALVLGGSMTFFRQATVTEVYASMAAALLISVSGLVAVARGAGPGVALPHAFFAGVAALGLHGSYRLLLIVPFAAVLGWRLRGGARWPLWAPALALLGAGAVTLYLPARSASGRVDALDWGHPRTAKALVEHVTAKRIRAGRFDREMLATDAQVVKSYALAVADRAEEDLGVLALVAAAGGVAALARRRRGRGPLLLLGALLVGDVAYAVWLNPMGVADRQTGVPLAAAVAVLAGVGVAWAAGIFGRMAPFGAAVLLVATATQPLLGGGAVKLAGRASEEPRAWAEAALAATPPAGVALLASDSMNAAFMWLTLVEPARPDVAGLARQHLWDTRRVRALTGATEVDSSRRPVAWEIAGGEEPRGAAWRPGIPMGLFGAAAAPWPVRQADVVKLFAEAALEDPLARSVARRATHDAGVLAARAGDHRRAAALEERALAIEETPAYRVSAARYRMALREDAAAAAHLDHAPVNAATMALRGVLAARAGKCAEAARWFERALAMDPAEPDALENRARLGGCRPR